jgi:hypothetical protein
MDYLDRLLLIPLAGNSFADHLFTLNASAGGRLSGVSMTKHARPRLYPSLPRSPRCDQCGEYRVQGNHQRCSKLRQALYARAKDK